MHLSALRKRDRDTGEHVCVGVVWVVGQRVVEWGAFSGQRRLDWSILPSSQQLR